MNISVIDQLIRFDTPFIVYCKLEIPISACAEILILGAESDQLFKIGTFIHFLASGT